jgi:hypothetical protein
MLKRGKTPVRSAAEARQLLDSLESDTLIGLRDRALIGLMVYSFAWVGAAVAVQGATSFSIASSYGCGCMKKAASVMKFLAILSWRPTLPFGPKRRELAVTRRSHYSVASARRATEGKCDVEV